MNEQSAILNRTFLIFGLILLLPTAIVFQLLRINLFEGDNLRDLWNNQAINYIQIPAQRGSIYDRNGSQLATNRVTYKIAVDPKAPGADRAKFDELGQVLAIHTGRSPTWYKRRIQDAPSRSRYIVLEDQIDIQAYEEITALDIPGLILEEEHRRSYGFGTLASHLLGFVNHDLQGMTGLEASYDEVLRGDDGLQQVRRDRSNRIFAYVGAPRKQPVHGSSLHTTLDVYIQAIVEEELRNGIERTGSTYGTAIVMDPRTGAILSIANYPDFDPNRPAAGERNNRRNYAISDMVEPGSTFKLVTALAAVEQGVVDFDEQFDTPKNGVKMIHGQVMRDHNPLGSVDFTGAIAKSSNIAVSEIAMRLTPEVFYQYARNLGFGTPTSIDLPNEEAGRLRRPYDWSQVTLPWMSIGYEVQATPIQILQAYAAFSNKGEMMRPYLVERITNEFGETIKVNQPSKVRQVAKKSTLEKLLPVFREVVSDSGTASWAEVQGLDIAGKTGTSQKLIDGRYQALYRASFSGFFPAEEPAYAILVMLDEPKTSYYGGVTAGSVFREIAKRIAGLDVNLQPTFPDNPQPQADQMIVPAVTGMKKEEARKLLSRFGIDVTIKEEGQYVLSQTPQAGDSLALGQRVGLTAGDWHRNVDRKEQQDDRTDPQKPRQDRQEGTHVLIPDLTGMNMRQATTLLQQLGLNVEQIGSGTIHNQFPKAGERMQKGRTVTIRGRIHTFMRTTISS